MSQSKTHLQLTFQVVQYSDRHDLADMQPSIQAFLSEGFFENHGRNPDTREFTPCFFCLLTPDDEVACWNYGFAADTLTMRGTSYPWIWTADLHTLPEWRGKGLASRLIDEGTQYVQERGIGRGSVFSTGHIDAHLSQTGIWTTRL